MATLEECRAALDRLAARLGGPDSGAATPDRSLSCHVSDLGTTFSGALRGGTLYDITTEPRPPAQIRLSTTSDDLVALTTGQLHVGKAWMTGRLKIDASMRDLLRIRSML